MALYVNTNVSSLNAQRMMANSTNSLDTSYKRLASGLRINSAKDDAAGLQIFDRLTSQINVLNQVNRNAQDGISFAQTAEGAMDEMTNMYQRIRTLALQSANGTNSTDDRTALQQEVKALCAEIDRIDTDTTWGGEALLSRGSISFQVGADSGQTISIDTKGKIGDEAIANCMCSLWPMLLKPQKVMTGRQLPIMSPTELWIFPLLTRHKRYWPISISSLLQWIQRELNMVLCRTGWSPQSEIRATFPKTSAQPEAVSATPTLLPRLRP